MKPLLLLSLIYFVGCSSFQKNEVARQPNQIQIDVAGNPSSAVSSLAGKTLIIKVDWAKTFRTITGIEAWRKFKGNHAWCLREYKKVVETRKDIQEMINTTDLGTERGNLMLAISSNAEKSVDITCTELIGESEATALKQEISNH